MSDAVTSAHWRDISVRWAQVGPPLRPSPEDVAFVAQTAREWHLAHGRPPRVLILGVTPELFHSAWPEGTVIKALDRSADMIGAVWPGEPSAATCGDWLALDAFFPGASFDLICCDGGLGLLSHPYGQRRFAQLLAKVLAPGGRVILRLFVPPQSRETPEAVLSDLRLGRVANMNVLKLRLLHALTPDPVNGVRLAEVFRRFVAAEPDFEALAARTGWPLAQIKAIESYRTTQDRYHLIDGHQAEANLSSAGLRLLARHLPAYADGALFPTMVFGATTPPAAGVTPTAAGEARLGEMIEGYRGTALAYVAVKLGLPAALAGGAVGAASLAEALGVSPEPLRRLLRGLVQAGLASEDPVGGFRLTELGAGLLPGRPGAVHALLAAEEFAPAWCGLATALSGLRPAFDHVFGQDVWSHRQASSELDTAYAEWMGADAMRVSEEIAGATDFGRHGLIADVGGGRGVLLGAILRRHPSCRGLLFERPSVVAPAARHLAESGLADRVEVVGGDFRADFMFRADAIVLKSVLHNWGDDEVVRLLGRCRQALAPDGRLYLVERVSPGRVAEDPYVVGLDLHMLAVTGGRERTRAEQATLLASARFDLVGVSTLACGLRLYEARI
jgi:SAM-dependent methyltransferase